MRRPDEGWGRWTQAPSDETARQALLATLPDYVTSRRQLNAAPAGHLPKMLRKRTQRLAIDLTSIPYHGKPSRDPEEIYRGQAKDGTSHFHASATAYVVRHGQRYTVALTGVKKGESLKDVVQHLLRQAARVGVRPRSLPLDRGFYSVAVVRYLQAARHPFLMPVVGHGRSPKQRGTVGRRGGSSGSRRGTPLSPRILEHLRLASPPRRGRAPGDPPQDPEDLRGTAVGLVEGLPSRTCAVEMKKEESLADLLLPQSSCRTASGSDSPSLSRLHTVAMAAFLTSAWMSPSPAAEPDAVTRPRASPTGAGGPMYAAPSGPDKFARISYPAAGLVDTQEGSVEMCVRNDFDSTVPLANPFYAPMTYVRVRDESGRRDILHVLARSVSGGRDLGVIVGGAESYVSVTGPEALGWLGWRGKGEWHYLAITWKTDLNLCELKLYQDGRLVKRVAETQSEPLLITANTMMYIGNADFVGSFAAVDELRVSAVERNAEEIKAASKGLSLKRLDVSILPTGFEWDALSTGFEWDRFTLLLDHFDRIEPDTSGKASWTLAEGGVRGHIEGALRAVPGRSGGALQLHVVEEELPGGGR